MYSYSVPVCVCLCTIQKKYRQTLWSWKNNPLTPFIFYDYLYDDDDDNVLLLAGGRTWAAVER